MIRMLRQVVVIIFCAFSLASCWKPYDNLHRQVLADEQLEIETNSAEMRLWETNDLSIYYAMQENGGSINLRGYVKINDSVTYTFPRADFLLIYVYLLNSAGISTSMHVIRPNISRYNMISTQRSNFGKIIPKDSDTAMLAFGYWGNFVDIEHEFRGGRMHSSGDDWQIYHSPFE